MNQSNQILWDIFQECNCTQIEFCKRIGMTYSGNISMWLSGKKELSLTQLEKICNKLGKTLIIKLK